MSRKALMFVLFLFFCIVSPVYAAEDCSLCHGQTISNFTLPPLSRTSECASCHNSGAHATWNTVLVPNAGYFSTMAAVYSSAQQLHQLHAGDNLQATTSSCNKCHGNVSCTMCHQNVGHANHSSTRYAALTQPAAIKTSYTNVSLSCWTSNCHQNLPTVVRKRGDNSDLCLNCHTITVRTGHGDVTGKHTLNFAATFPQQDCSQCHLNNLMDEHARRRGTDGNLLTCSSCHNSQRQEVKDAIKQNNIRCDACHTLHGTDVSSYHLTNFDGVSTNCGNCHQANLTGEHIGKRDRQGNSITCSTCHDNTSATVQTAIALNNTQCTGCHTPHVNPTVMFEQAPMNKAAVCYKCHKAGHNTSYLDPGGAGWFQSAASVNSQPAVLHSVHRGDNLPATTSSCQKCHFTVACQACHIDLTHGSHSSTQYQGQQLRVANGTSILVLQENCTNSNCHGVLGSVKRLRADGSQLCLNCHNFDMNGQGDINALHQVFVAGSNCTQCHQATLTGEHAARTDRNGQAYDCNLCHGASVPASVAEAVNSGNVDCSACHSGHAEQYQNYHLTDWSGYSSSNCSECHSNDLLTQHTGKTCDTCHKSNQATVRQAVLTGNARCDACHTIHGNLSGTHVITYQQGSDCVVCHKTDISEEHLKNLTSLGKTNLSCESCHQSSNPAVQAAIATRNNDCSACHSTIHQPAGQAFSEGQVNKSVTCKICHYVGHGNVSVILPEGNFATTNSLNLTAAEIHRWHNGDNLAATTSLCMRCHAQASCKSCHSTVNHEQHGQVAARAEFRSSGASYSLVPLSCNNSACHDTGYSIRRVRPDNQKLCRNCHSFDYQ